MKALITLSATVLLGFFCAVNAVAAVDRSFPPGAGLGGGDETGGYVVVPLADGRILVGGDFDTYNGVTRPNLARLHGDGSLDETVHLLGGVDADEEPAIWSVGLQPDGKIIVSGHFTTISGVPARLARLHPNGALEAAWLPQFRRVSATSLRSIVLPDGRILVWTYDGIERLNADGSIDTTFDVALDGFLLAGVSRQADGRILLAGALNSINGVPVGNVARLHADGSLDTTFATRSFGEGPLGLNWAYGAEQMRDGRVLVFGRFGSIEGRARAGLALLRSNGRLDTSASFAGERDYVWRARALSDGSIVAHSVREALYPSGFDVTLFSQRNNRKKMKGRPWRIEFSVFPNGYVSDIAEDASGRLLIAGEFWAINGVRVPAGIARLERE